MNAGPALVASAGADRRRVMHESRWSVPRSFEGYFILGRSYPGIVSIRRRRRAVAARHARHARAAQVPDPLSARSAGP